uniref:Chemosensory protein 5 n=1 Tax=Sitobion avenae TaxID=44664 RepID=A0A1I9ZKY1_9HEMI|nr:chemosensory protein 5 [Sitobion avenae]
MNLLAIFCYITMMCDSQFRRLEQPTAIPQVKRIEQPATIATRIGQATIAPRFGQPTVAPRFGQPTIAPRFGQATAAPQTGEAAIGPRIGQTFQNVNDSVSPTTDGRKTTRETSSYPTRYDFIDIEAVMNNDRIIKILFNCVMNQGPCTREGLELKRIVPDAIQTECAKCNERQRKQAGKVLAHLLQYKPEYWNMLVKKFDPNNIYLRKYMADNDDDEKLSLQKLSNNTTK